ncbi:NUMOD1 domain-containing DNA-binding protein [Flavitalea sp.]|nr:NUMOD1 domain-containing DNA-binding protein [Flavitalea sp.]
MPKDYNKYPFRNMLLENMPGEEWGDLPGFDGYTCVSNYGRVWSYARLVELSTGQCYYTKDMFRKQSIAKSYNQYTKEYSEQLRVKIRYGGINHSFMVNRLVYDLFVAPLDTVPVTALVVHKDGDNCNNHFSNLVLMNGTELYIHDLGLKRRPRSGRKIKVGEKIVWAENNAPRPVVQYLLNGKKVNAFESIDATAKATGYHRSSIRDSINQKVIQLNGFVFRFKGDRYRGEYKSFSYEKEITQYSLEGKIIRSYPSLKQASDLTGITADTISSCARRKGKLGGGFVWRFKNERYNGEFVGMMKNKRRVIVQYLPDGKKINTFPSIRQAAIFLKVSEATLRDCAMRKTRISHGYVWRVEGETYHGEYEPYIRSKPVAQYSLKNKLIAIHESIELAANASGLTPANIQKNASGKNYTAGGFIWKPVTQEQRFTLMASRAKHAAKTPLFEAPAVKIKTRTGKKVTQYNLAGAKIRTFTSTKEAERLTGVHATSISAVANKKFNTTGRFIWIYGDGPKKLDITKHFSSTAEKIRAISIPVIKFSIEGELLETFPSIAEAARSEKIAVKTISAAVNGKTKSAGGFLWERKPNDLTRS